MTFPELCHRLATQVGDCGDLDRVPRPVIAAAIEHGLRFLADHVPAGFDVSEIEGAETEQCNWCDNFITPAAPGDAAHCGEDDTWICPACIDEKGPP